jgi:hypothetical protein
VGAAARGALPRWREEHRDHPDEILHRAIRDRLAPWSVWAWRLLDRSCRGKRLAGRAPCGPAGGTSVLRSKALLDRQRATSFTAVPANAWANRAKGTMPVWAAEAAAQRTEMKKFLQNAL